MAEGPHERPQPVCQRHRRLRKPTRVSCRDHHTEAVHRARSHLCMRHMNRYLPAVAAPTGTLPLSGLAAHLQRAEAATRASRKRKARLDYPGRQRRGAQRVHDSANCLAWLVPLGSPICGVPKFKEVRELYVGLWRRALVSYMGRFTLNRSAKFF